MYYGDRINLLTAITVSPTNPDSSAPRWSAGRFPAFGLRPSDPGPHRRPGQIEVPGHLPDRRRRGFFRSMVSMKLIQTIAQKK
jgi:hypothetical protein